MALASPELTSHENTRIGVIFDGKLIFRCLEHIELFGGVKMTILLIF